MDEILYAKYFQTPSITLDISASFSFVPGKAKYTFALLPHILHFISSLISKLSPGI